MKTLLVSLCLLLATVVAPSARAADDPGDLIRSTVGQVFDVLRDRELQKPERRKDRLAKLRGIADRVFDWDGMAQSSLGVAYRRITDDQRKEYVRVFKDLIADEYMDDLDRFMGDEQVSVQGVDVQGDVRVVRTLLVTHSRERVPIWYYLHARGNGWMIHDFSIEGVSLVNHYRNSFSNFLVNHEFGDLLERLKSRRAS
jgi:phospholipid transport system substrate-binding protein